MRYLRYRLERGTFEVTVILVSPEKMQVEQQDKGSEEHQNVPSLRILTLSPS